MIKKTVTYEDFDGNMRTEELHFNLTQLELTEMAMELPDGFIESMDGDPSKVDGNAAAARLAETLGGKGILDFIKKLVLKSYGIKSADGRKFEKSEELTKDFSQTLAFDAMIMEFMQDDIKAAEFVNGVIPAKLADKLPANGMTVVK